MNRGICSEEIWQYTMVNLNTKPDDADNDAGRHLISGSEELDTVADMKTNLLNGFPFVMEMALFPDFDTYVSVSGEFSMPDDNPSPSGTHAVVVTGYNDDNNSFIIRNTKGESWGNLGYFYMSDEYIARNDLVFRAVKIIK